jgi:hypothetical protein
VSDRDRLRRDEHPPEPDELRDAEEAEADRLRATPGKLTLADGAVPAARTSVSPGKVNRASAMMVQMRARRGSPGSLEHRTAARGVAGSGDLLPHFDAIQAAFGRHDISDVRAHGGEQAAGAARSLGARAYATGSDVAFAESPDLFTAAHEAAHVVQQRGGVQLAGGFGREGDRYERHADAVADAVVRGDSAQGLLDQMAPPGGASTSGSVQRAVQLHPDRDDEVRVRNEETPRTHVLSNSTHRFAALMHIYESGDFGTGGLTPSTVVGRNGETLEQLYQMYRRGEIASTNAPNSFRPAHAAGIVEDIRERGFISSQAEAERLGIATGDQRDRYSPINVEPVEEGQDPGPDIDQRLSVDHSIRGFIVNGHTSGREANNERRNRTSFLENLQHDGSGNWTHRDGSPLSDEETRELRQHLVADAERTGALRGGALTAYRDHVTNSSNPPLDAQSWVRTEDIAEAPSATGATNLDDEDPEFHRRIRARDYGGAVGHVADSRTTDDGGDGGETPPPTGADPASARRPDPASARRPDPNGTRLADANEPAAIPPPTDYHPDERARRSEDEDEDGDGDERARTGRRQPETEGELGTSGGSLSRGGFAGGADVDPSTGRVRGSGTAPTGGGTRTRLRAGGGQTADGGTTTGGDARVTVPTSGGRSASATAGVNEERGPDGELRGRDRTAGASFDGGPVGVGVTVGDGWRCYADRVVHDNSDPRRFTIPWRLQVTRQFAAELEIRIGGGFTVGEELERSGTEVIVAESSSPEAIEAARERAESWRGDFHRMNRSRVDSLFADDPGQGGHSNHDIEYWRDAAVGQSERVRSQSTLGASVTVPIGQYLELGGGYEHQGSESSEIAKHDEQHIRVTQVVGSREGGEGTAGAMGTSLTAGEREIRMSTVVTQANLTTAEGQITQFLATGRTLRPDGNSVTLISVVPTTGTAQSHGVSFLGLGVTNEGQVLHSRGVRRNEETGELEEVNEFEGQRSEQQRGLGGMRQQSDTRVVAPTGADDDYIVTQTIQGNREQAVRNELSEATGNSRRDVSDTNVTTGTWQVSERFTQEQIANFCTRFVARHREVAEARGRDPDARVTFFGIELEPTGPYDTLYRRLASIPDGEGAEAEQTARERRSEAVSEFLQATGQEGVRLIRASAGGGSEQVVTRTHADGQADTNFMSIEERARLDAAIARWRTQIQALQRSGATLRSSRRQAVPVSRDEAAARARADDESLSADERQGATEEAQRIQRANQTAMDAENAQGPSDGLESTGDVEVLRTQITGELTQMRSRREAMMNEHNYRTLPGPERLEIDQGYERYIGELETLLTQLQAARDENIAGSYGEETQSELHEMEATRSRALEIRGQVQELREHTLNYRRRFGQIDSETWEYRLSDEDRRESNRRFRVAEEARNNAEQYLEAGAATLEDIEGRMEGTVSPAFSGANRQYERAAEEFEAARQILTRLNRVYGNAERGNPGRQEDDQSADTSESEDGERPARRQRRRAAREPASSRESAGTSPTEQARRSEREPEPAQQSEQRILRFQIDRQRLGRLISVVNGVVDVDMPRIRLESGLVVQPLGPGACERMPGGDGAVGGLELYGLRLRVEEAASSSYTHLVTTCLGRSGEEIAFRIANAEGETFASSAVRAPEIEF